ncbi:hypothetical protein Vafri_18451 [Volvox africanus]|nr:hypothetical protein Vafri_18451 [Volvox africanus]
MLATSCRRLLALRLPQNLSAWAPALVHIEPWTLLDIMSSDHLAVSTEYDRYELVKQVAKICAATEEAAGTSEDAAVDNAAEGNHGEGFATASGSTTTGTIVVQRMLSSALRLSDKGLAGHLDLARPCSSGGMPCPGAALAAPGAEPATIVPAATDGSDSRALSSRLRSSSVSSSSISAGVGDTDSDVGLACSASPVASATETSPSECAGADGASVFMSSQASSRSTFRLDELGSGTTAVERIVMISSPGGGDQNVVKTVVAVAAPAPQEPSQSPKHIPVRTHGTEVPDVTGGPGSPGPADSGAGVVATAAARLLLNEAVRYEHLTVPQLMAVEREGLVPAQVLQASLWERTRLDCEIHYRGMQPYNKAAATNGQAAPVAARGGDADAVGTPEESVQVGMQALQSRIRAFRVCWRLTCGALRKLQPRGLLQSELHQYAGALWQLRLCCSGGSRSHLGLFLGRHLAGAIGEGSTAALWQQRQGAHTSPARQPDLGREAQVLAPRRRRPGRPVRRQRPLEPPVAIQQQEQALADQPFFAYRDHKSSLRAQCRLSVFQSDNTALQGRLCLGDTGDFTADFAAGGYFGQAQLVARADLLRLADEQEVYVFMSLQVLMDGM